MISSRRLAREWALKILYQMDIGATPLADARESALERLRNEFVQKGSRSASGSTAEQLCLEYVTSTLSDAVYTLRPEFEQAVSKCLVHVFSSAPCWQEAIFERVFKTKFKGHKLRPSRLLLANLSDPVLEFQEWNNGSSRALTEMEITRLTGFASDLAAQLPILLYGEMRRTVRDSVLALQTSLPVSTLLWDAPAEQNLLDERNRRNTDSFDRWRKVSQIVQKQTSDWLRVSGFTVLLVNFTDERRAEIDSILTELASGWKLERQAAVDRNILRLAALEMLFIPDIPFTASINEAVELAKKFSTAESGRFVNGILGAVALRLGEKVAIADPIIAPDDGIIDDMIDSNEFAELDEIESHVERSESTPANIPEC